MSARNKSPLSGALAAVALGAALGIASGAVDAQQATVSGLAVVAPGAATGVNGVIAVNESAGLNNAQSNQFTIATGTDAGNGNFVAQSAGANARPGNAIAQIGSGAFANMSGAAMVNQSAGMANLQSNSAQIGTAAVGVETVSDGELSAAAATNGGRGQMVQSSGIREASIGNSAFRNATGLVQVNQTAGAGNATANSFVLRPPAGTLF